MRKGFGMQGMIGRAVVGLASLLVTAGAAMAAGETTENDGPFATAPWTQAQAAEEGWRRTEIVLGSPALDYATYLPPDADVETAPFEGDAPPGPGRVKVVAAYKLPFPFGQIEGTVTAFQLRDTGSAARLCGRLVEIDGYVPRVTDVRPDRTHAQIFSASFDASDNPETGAFTDCRTRGHELLVHHFRFPLAPAAETREIDARIDAALTIVLPLLSNMTFTNGSPDGYGNAAQPIELRIGTKVRTLPVPKALAVSFNDFGDGDGDGDGDGAQELHLLEQRDGKARAMIWLGVQPMPERPDLAEIGVREAERQLRLQSDDLSEIRLLSNEAMEASEAGAPAGQTFRFAVSGKGGEDAGILEGETFWNAGRLFVVSLWTNLGEDDGSFTALIARLPSQTAYDLVRIAVRDEQ